MKMGYNKMKHDLDKSFYGVLLGYAEDLVFLWSTRRDYKQMLYNNIADYSPLEYKCRINRYLQNKIANPDTEVDEALEKIISYALEANLNYNTHQHALHVFTIRCRYEEARRLYKQHLKDNMCYVRSMKKIKLSGKLLETDIIL